MLALVCGCGCGCGFACGQIRNYEMLDAVETRCFVQTMADMHKVPAVLALYSVKKWDAKLVVLFTG